MRVFKDKRVFVKLPARGEIDFQDKRIFVLLPEKVEIPGEGDPRAVRMPLGRLAVQLGHVVSKMRIGEIERYGEVPITTIAYSVRNTRELILLSSLLEGRAQHVEHTGSAMGFSVFYFSDRDIGFYGIDDDVLTAVCTSPVPRAEIESVLGHLELFGREEN
jgi:peptidyl-tRNA hydrolase